MLTIRQFEGEESRSGSECSVDQEGISSWRGLEEGGGGVSAHLVTPPPQLQLRKSGVWARAPVPAGVRFGPFLGKWVLEPANEDYAWEVLVPSAGIRGFLDASEFGTWLKFIRRQREKQNLKHVLLAGQIFYETLREIRPEEELCLGDRDPIQLDGGAEEGRQEETLEDREEDEALVDEDNGVKCLVCDKIFPDVYILDKHMVDNHRYDPDKYICEHCSKGFAWRPNLLRHKMIHGEFRRFPCENCDKVFTDPSNLQRHIRTTHVGARCHACPECGKTFATSSGLKQHTHIHSSVKPFRCEVCFKSYTQFSNLCRHKRMHANCRMQIKCHKCGQAFSTVTSLSKHRRFCDSTPSPFMHGQPKLSPLDLPGPDLLGNGNGHFSPLSGNLNSKFGHGPSFFQPPFSSHLQNLFGPGGGHGFPFLHNPSMMFPSMLQRMALNHLNGKPILSPNMVSSPEPAELTSLADNKSSAITSAENKLYQDKKLENIKSNISDFRSIEEFRQRLINGSFNKTSEPTEGAAVRSQLENNLVVSGRTENSSQKVEIKKEVDLAEDPAAMQERNQGFDVNRNKSDREPEKVKLKERPLDLSTPRKDGIIDNGPQSDIEMESSALLNTRNVKGKVPTKEFNERAESPRENKVSVEGSPEEPRGFKPVGPGKSFVPVTEFNLYPKSSSDQLVSAGSSPFSRPPLLHSQEASLPFHRPVNPFLLGAMYRMHHQPHYSSFHPTLSPTLPPIAPRPLPFSPPFMSPLHSSPFLPSSLPLLGRLGCYQDVLTGSHSKTKDRYACKFCGKVFPRSANLTRHLRTHTGEQPYKCKYCERSFSISSNLQRHVRNIHNKEKPFKCPLCERCFGQQTNLERHLKKHETCSDPSEIVDSPESCRTEDDLGYFDEIRSFMGKVVDKNSSLEDTSDNDVDVEDEDEDEMD